MSIGENIHQRRRLLDLTQAGLAQKVNVTSKTIGLWESNERVPKGDALQKLASALNTSVAYLMGETDNPTHAGMAETPALEQRKSSSAEMFERLMGEMARHSPDLVVHFRDLDKNIDKLEPADIQGLADGFAILTGKVTKEIEERMRTKSRHVLQET